MTALHAIAAYALARWPYALGFLLAVLPTILTALTAHAKNSRWRSALAVVSLLEHAALKFPWQGAAANQIAAGEATGTRIADTVAKVAVLALLVTACAPDPAAGTGCTGGEIAGGGAVLAVFVAVVWLLWQRNRIGRMGG